MKVNYRGEQYHSLQIGDYHTYDDWSLVPMARPSFLPPQVQTNIVAVPGSHTVLDFTNVFSDYTGGPPLAPVKTSIEFMVSDRARSRRWWDLYSEIKTAIHGKRLQVFLLDDPDYYYNCLVEVGEWKSGDSRSTITIDFTPDPYKLEKEAVTRSVTVDGSAVVTLKGSPMPAVPTITITAAMTVAFDGTTYGLTVGENVMDDILLLDGTNELTFAGTGTVTITYQRGML